jgi:hypothetical protein
MPNKKSETEETHAMPHPPNKDSIKGLLPADFDCTQQPLPDKLKVLLCLLDGARIRRCGSSFDSYAGENDSTDPKSFCAVITLGSEGQ